MKRLVVKRERLYKVVWEEPISKLCEKYYISENKLKEICKYLCVPIPTKSYWTQYHSEKNLKPKELPEYSGEDEYIEYINEYDIKRKEELKSDSLAGYEPQERDKIRKACMNIDIHQKVENFHPLVLKRKSTINAPQKKLGMYEIRESKQIKERIDLIYHIIFSVIENLGYEVEEINGKYVVWIQGEEIPFTIREKAKIEYRDSTEKDDSYDIVYVKRKRKIREIVASGDLELKIDSYGKKDIWNDTPKTKLEDKIGEIIVEFFYCATKEKNRRSEREEEHRQYEEEERKRFERRTLLRPRELRRVFEIGKKVSKITLGMSGSKLRTYILEDVIEKMVLHLGSYIKITTDFNMNELDISMLATIARNIMECSNTYFYYAERKITDEEIEFRYHIANLHYDNNMMDIVNKFKYPKNNFRTQTLELGKELSIEKIKKSPIYDGLSKIEKSQVLNGNQAYINKRQKELHTILEKDIESAIYNIFSNSAHSYYIGLGTNSINGSFMHASYITPEMLLCLATEVCIIYSANVLADYLQLRKGLNQYVTDEEKDFVKEMVLTDKLLNWLEAQREEYGDTFFDMKWEDNTEDIIV